MGLAGPKRRTKISSDPNNTAWSSSTDRFGHKILTSQGWTPGDYLGATNANHQQHYTAANASHIRVLLKDDNLGLGAARKREGAETFGLDQFSGLLGRLNGKTEEVLAKEDDSRRDVRLRLWADRRGGVRFVSAGFLVGDKVEKLRREEVERKEAEQQRAKGKKRKANGEVKDEADIVSASTVAHAEQPSLSSEDDEDMEVTTDAIIGNMDEKAAKRQRKAEKKKRSADKALRREEKRLRRAAKESKRRQRANGDGSEVDTTTVEVSSSETATPSTPLEEVVVESVDSSGETHQKTIAIPRRMIRSRYIQQKRMAGLDPKALNEIFMIKTPVG